MTVQIILYAIAVGIMLAHHNDQSGFESFAALIPFAICGAIAVPTIVLTIIYAARIYFGKSSSDQSVWVLSAVMIILAALYVPIVGALI